MKHYFGAHMDGDNLIEATEKIKNAGGNIVQIFLTMRGSVKTEHKTNEELNNYKEYLTKNDMKVVVHSSYMHNISKEWDEYSWWIKNLEIEIKYCHIIGAIGLVLHFGKQLDLSIEEAYNNMYTALLYIHNKTLQYTDIPIFLETSTGQGSETCYRLEEMAHFFRKFSKNENKLIKNRFRLCVDTCHVFAAGYNIQTKKYIKSYLEAFEELIGIRYIALIHLNDSKVNLGEQKDRHDNIGKGYIGLTGLTEFFRYFKKLNVPIILETPDNGYRMEIKLLNNIN